MFGRRKKGAEVDHDQLVGPSTGGQHGLDGLDGDPGCVVAAPGQDRQPRHPRQSPVQGRRGDAAAGRTQVRPTRPAVALAPEDKVDATAERVAVDEQRQPSAARRGDGQRAGQRGRARPTASTDDRHDRPCRPKDLDGVGEAVGEPRLSVGQHEHVLRAELDGPLPDVLGRRVRRHQHDPRPTGQPGPQAGLERVDGHQHQRRGGP